jgi:hypothetical protein
MAEMATEAANAAPVRPQVLYVMGAGRSGSTILGVTLGNYEGVFYAGELDAWLARSGEPQLGGDERTRFWERVRAGVGGAQPLYGREPQRAIERSLALFRLHKLTARRRMRGPYRRVAESLFRSIADAAQTRFIVDTSHYPLRARELQALAGIDLYILYLVRDPRSVVSSFRDRDVAQYSKSFVTANVYLWLTNALSVLVFLRQPAERRLFVRYEDFVAAPERVASRILALAGAPTAAPDFSSLRTGVPFQGNRLIASETISLNGRSAGTRPPRGLATMLLQLPFRAVWASLSPRTSSSPRMPAGTDGEPRAVAQ